MPPKRAVKLRCPICKKAVTSSAVDFPFCSDRCRLIDLGRWVDEEYRVSEPLFPPPPETEERD